MERKRFVVHRDLICGVVPFFQKAFGGGFSESISGEISLPEEHPGAFKLFVFWLYKGEFSVPTGDSEGTIGLVTKDTIPSFFQLYITGEKWCNKEIQKASIQIIYQWFALKGNEAQVHALTKVIYDLYDGITAESQKARFLAVRQSIIVAMRHGTEWLDRLLEDEENFALDFGKESWRLLQKGYCEGIAGVKMDYFFT